MTDKGFELEDLLMPLSALCDGTLSDDDKVRLEELLECNASARECYVAFMDMHGELCFDSLSDTCPSIGRQGRQETAKGSPVLGFLGDATQLGSMLLSKSVCLSLALSPLAVIAILIFLVFWIVPQNEGMHEKIASKNQVDKQEIVSRPVAKLLGAVDCKWNDKKSNIKIGDCFYPGQHIDVESGFVEIAFNSGAKVILQGPVMFTPTSSSTGHLKLGRLTAMVPERAIGFTVDTPPMRVTDLGTEFGVEVDEQESAEVHVFVGAIEAQILDVPGQTYRLEASQSMRFDRQSARLTNVKYDQRSFVRELRDVVKLPDVDKLPDDSLIAYCGFSLKSGQKTSGLVFMQLMSWRNKRCLDSFAAGSLVYPGICISGDRFVAKGDHSQSVGYLDVAVGGPFDRLNYVADRGGKRCIGVSGRTLYMSWLTQATHSGPQGSAGLSLLHGDNVNERLFIGKVDGRQTFSHNKSPSGIMQLDGNTDTEAVEPEVVDSQTHLWVVKIEFREGDDIISIFLDPQPGEKEPHKSNSRIDNYNIEFDRIRISSQGVEKAWNFDEIRFGNTWNSVVPRNRDESTQPGE